MLQDGYNRGGLRLIACAFNPFTKIHSLHAASAILRTAP